MDKVYRKPPDYELRIDLLVLGSGLSQTQFLEKVKDRFLQFSWDESKFSKVKLQKYNEKAYEFEQKCICEAMGISLHQFEGDIYQLVDALGISGPKRENANRLIVEFYGSFPNLARSATVDEMIYGGSTIEPWIPTNHSKAKPDFVKLSEAQEDSISALIRKCYGIIVSESTRLEIGAHSVNYRIRTDDDDVFLLKFYKYPNAGFVKARIEKELYVASKKVFGRLNPCLEALVLKHGAEIEDWDVRCGESSDKTVNSILCETQDTVFFSVYPFALSARHFSAFGNSDSSDEERPTVISTQLSTLAESYARLQKVFSKWESTEHSEETLMVQAPKDMMLRSRGIINIVSRSTRSRKSSREHKLTPLWDAHSKVLDKAYKAFSALSAEERARRKQSSVQLLYDLHPHNAFFDDRSYNCELIFDYEKVNSDFSEEETFAFAMHRFIREAIRAFPNLPHEERSGLVKVFAKSMIEAYGRSGGNLSGSFQEKLGSRIMATNYGKFINNMFYLCGGVDPVRRSEYDHKNEIVKFVAYMKEAEFF